MPANSSSSVTLNIQAQVTGYEQSIKDMRQTLEKLDPGSKIGKNLKKGLDEAEKHLKSLMKNVSSNVSSNAQIEKVIGDVNKLGETLASLGEAAQDITGKDLKLSALGEDAQSVIADLQKFREQLDNNIGKGIEDFIKKSDKLQESLSKILGTDVTKLGYEEIFKRISAASQEAEKNVKKTQDAVEKAQKVQTSAQAKVDSANTRQKKIEQSEIDLTASKDKYLDSYKTIYKQLTDSMIGLLGEDKSEIGKEILDKFFDGLTPETAKDKVEEIVKAINDALGTKTLNVTKFKSDFLGLKRGQNIYKNEILGEMKAAQDEARENITANEGISPTQAAKAIKLIDEGQIEKGVEDAIKRIKEAKIQIQREINRAKDELANATDTLETAQQANSDVLEGKSNLDSIQEQLKQKVDELTAKNKELEDRIAELEQQKDTTLNTTAATVKQEMGRAGKSARDFEITREEANKYSAALEKVQNAEQALGRLKGVVQQWFSVYAAVRMVTKAIRNIINTLTSLDKVITEIAIVTNMTQSELWGQMNSYAKMAQTYAASIEGVYQVSQLYYQQGLQTADVMALTEQTLKMARISGLGYAEATDYMTNAVRAFNMEMTDAQRVVDVYSAVAASSATNTTELAEAMSKTASSAHAVGSSFENTTAMMAVMIESTRESAQNIGSSLKSIISRYGEMKADPSALIDSEGQEMSLNKVDKALQSVGISIHDATGQFRDFDDVIMELAASWDSIDRNTQRYIATIMAGNRQQSRFLALVSGYDRLKELSEEAMNSEDASQLQFLKTLDSIEAKTQQIKTSFQELYVNSGLEKFYKGLLDYGNQLVQTFTRMPKLFGLPIPALIKFGSQFYTLAKIIKTVFRGISGIVMAEQKKFALLTKAANNEILSEDERAKVERILNKKDEYKQLEEVTREGEERLTNAAQQGNEKRAKAAKSKINRGKIGSIVGTAVSSAGMGLTLAAAGIDETKSLDERSKKAKLTGWGSALSGIGTGIATGMSIGGVWGAIAGGAAGLFAGLPGIIEAVGLASESTSEKIDRLNKAVEETNNKVLQSKDELKSLEEYKQKYDELYKVRNRDAESRQEWLDLNNEIVANYPGLFGYLDAEGNKIADLTNNYDAYLNAKRKAYENDLVENVGARVAAAKDEDAFLAEYGIDTSGKIFKEAAHTTLGGSYKDRASSKFGNIVKKLALGQELSEEDLTIVAPEKKYDSDKRKWKTYYDTGEAEGVGAALFAKNDARETFFDEGAAADRYENLNKATQIVVRAIQNGAETIGEVEQILAKDFNGLKLKEDSFFALKNAHAASEGLSELYEQGTEATDELVSYYLAQQENASEISSLVRDRVIKNAEASLDTYLKENNDVDVETATKHWWNRYRDSDLMDDVEKQTDNLFDGIIGSTRESINDVYNDLGSYSLNDLKTRLKTLGVSQESELYSLIIDTWYERYESMVGNFMTTIGEAYSEAGIRPSASGMPAFLASSFGPEQLSTIQTLYTDILTNNGLNKRQKNKQTSQLDNLFTKVTTLSQEQQETFFANLIDADLTSITGIYDFLNSLVSAGIDIDETGIETILFDLSQGISINFVTEFNTLTDSIQKKLTDFNKALSNAQKGMDVDDAIAMANKLGLTLKDFRFENGKYYFDNAEKIEQAYLDYDTELRERLNNEVDAEIGFLTGASEDLESYEFEFQKTDEERLKFLEKQGYSEPEAETLVKYYNQYYDEWLKFQQTEEGKDVHFDTYVIDKIKESQENLDTLLDEYTPYQINSILIQQGYLREFFSRVLNDTYDSREIEDLIRAGDYAGLPDEIKPYFSLLYSAIVEAEANVFKNLISSINDERVITGTAQSNEEKELLEKLGADFEDGSMSYVFKASADKIKEYKNILLEAYNNDLITLSQYNDYLSQLIAVEEKNDKSKAILAVAKDYKHISASTAASLSNAYGKTAEELNLEYDELAQEYSIDPQSFKNFVDFRNKWGDFSLEEYNEIARTIDEYDRKNAPETILKNIVDNRTKITEADIESIAKLLDEDYNIVKEHLQQNADGTYTAGFAYLYSIMDAAGYEYNATIEESLAKQYDDIIEQAIGIVSTQTKGYTKVADMKQFETQLANNGIDFGDSTLYEWDTDIHAFVLSAEGIKKQWELINKEIEGVDKNSDEYYYYTRLVNDTTRQLAENVYSQIANLISSDTATRAQATSKFKKAIDDYNTWLGAQIEGWEGIDSQLALNTIQGGGISAVAMAKTFAGLAGIQLSDSDIQELYRGRVAPLMDAIEQVTATAGEIVSKTAADIIRNAGGKVHEIAGTGQYVVDTAANVVEAYHAIYEELVASGEATLGELNALKAKELESKYKVTELGYLSSAAEMSYEEFGQVLESMGIRLTEEIFDALGENITQLSNGKLRINNFEGFARALGVDITSDAYISAFKAYNDSMINLNKQTEKAITEEVNAIGSAGLGDKINVTTLFTKLTEDQLADLNKELFDWGANITDGILDIGENANLAGVINTIYNAVKGTDLMLEKDVEALADALDSVLKAFAEGLQKGITGTLTNVEAYDLQTTAHNMFGIDLDFTKTADGLKISAEQATTLYYRLKEVDSFSARLVFDGLKDSLTETGKACENMTSTLAEIHKLEEKLSKGPDNAEVRERLNLYREIASVQMMNDPGQYSFMDNKLPDMLQGPENYWNAWDDAFKSMKTAAQKGYISTQDFYNIVNEMSNVARLTGDPIMLMGEELDGSLEKASALIQKGFNALTIVQGQGAQIDLSNMGLQVTGIKDMTNMTDKALKQVAQANIDMLDSMIQLLEVVVAMEDLGDVDIDQDNELDFSELFNPDKLGEGFTATDKTRKATMKILVAAEKNDDLKKALETFLIGEESIEDILKKLADPNYKFTPDEANKYQKILQAVYDAYLNGDYDLDNLQQSIIDIFSKEFGEVDTIQIGDKKYVIGYGTTLVPNENGEYVTTPDNAKFTDPKEALQHQAMLDAGILAENIGDYDTETEITTGKKILKDGSSVTIEVGEKGVKYSVSILPGKKYDSFDDAMTAWYNYEQHEGLTTDTKETWAAGKGWEIPVTTDFSENTDDPFYQIMVDGVRDVVVNLVEGDIPDILKKIFGLDGGTPTPTPTPDSKNNKPKAIYDDGSEYNPVGKKKPPKKSSTTTSEPTETDTSSFDAASAALDTLKTTAQTLADAIPSVVTSVTTLSTAINDIPSGISGRISSLALAMKQLPEKKTIAAIVNFKFTGLSNNTPPEGTVIIKGAGDKAGNVALKSGRQRTLMGELGPELVVSKGRYFVVGQNGAEMVDLDPDAVVFNHLQTKRLLKNGKAGRGKAVTNERNAVSMATGNTSGPAMASAKAALAALKQLRAMWESLLGASLSDLGALGGSGGGGGGGGGGGKDPKSNAGFIADLERWYNLLRQISKLEKDITYQETLRSALWKGAAQSGQAYYDSLKKSLDALSQTAAKQAELSELQKSYYDRRVQDLKNSAFAKIFTFNEQGEMQYNDNATLPGGQRGGLFALSELNRRNADGSSYYTAKQQYEMLKKWGFEKEMKYDSQGKEIVYDKDSKNADDYYTKAVQAFWDKADAWKDELDGLFDSYTDALKAAQDAVKQTLEIYRQLDEAQIKLENTVLDTIVAMREKEIQDLQDVADNMQETADKYIEGLNNALQREQDMYKMNQQQEDLDKNRRRLAILQRTGASASEIASLQNTIDDQAQQMYFDKQQQQIDAIQEASDAQIEKLNQQIDLMTTQLDYEKANGLLWDDVYKVLSGTQESVVSFITTNHPDFLDKSEKGYKVDVDDLTTEVGNVLAYLKDKDATVTDSLWAGFKKQLENSPEYKDLTDEEKQAAEKAFRDKYAETGDYLDAQKAALDAVRKTPNAEQKEEGKKAAEEFFGNEKNTAEWKKTYKAIYTDETEKAMQQLYQDTYAKEIKNGATKEAAAEAARKAVEDELTRQYREATLGNYGENKIKSLVRSAIGKNKFNKELWEDISEEVEQVYKDEYMASGSETSATQAAVDEYKKLQKATNAEKYWDSWTSTLKKLKNPNNEQKRWKKLLSTTDPNKKLIIDEAFEQFKANFKGKTKKARRKNARDAAKSVFRNYGYRQGGSVDFTGLAQVHGTPQKPEYFLNASDTAMWKHDILGTQSGSLTSSLLDLNSLVQNMVTGNKIVRDDAANGFSIGNIEFTMNATIANDYDAKKAGRLAFEEMLKIAQKTGTTSLSRR